MTSANIDRNEQELDELEGAFPLLAGAAFSTAYDEAIAAGLSVMVSEDGQIVEVSPDGRRKVIKRISPPIRVEPGRIYTIP